MRQNIEKAIFDWSRSKSPRVQARGVAAVSMFSHKIDVLGNIKSEGSTKCVWNELPMRSSTRYLTRKVWNNL